MQDEIAKALRAKWDASPYEIHKRPPFREHSFDSNDRFWVVGSTTISVLQGWSGSQTQASAIAQQLNDAGSS
jgi:hypothetical protein